MRNMSINGLELQANDLMAWQKGGAENLTETLGEAKPTPGTVASTDKIAFSSSIHPAGWRIQGSCFRPCTHTCPPNQPYTYAHMYTHTNRH